MKTGLFKGKSRRTKTFAAITSLLIVLFIGLNFLLTYFGLQKTIFLDMTPEGLYTLSDVMVEECDKMFAEISEKGDKQKVEVVFCTDPDYLVSSETSRLNYFMALKLEEKYPDNFNVKTVNVKNNPTAVAKYKTTSLSDIGAGNIIVSYGDRYRISTNDKFWVEGSNKEQFYNGEYRLATLIKSVTAIGQPSAYFVVGHGETYYDPDHPETEMSLSMAAFADLIKNRGLTIKLLDLSAVDRVPDDCALLIINNPTKDFTYDETQLNSFNYVSETEKLDRYLVMKQGAIMVARDYDERRREPLTVFDNFLHEWGFDFSDSVVVDNDSSLDVEDENKKGTNIIALYDTDSESYGYALYGEYADLSSAPLTVIPDAGSVDCSFGESTAQNEPGTGYASRVYTPFLTSSHTAQKFMKDENGIITKEFDGLPGTQDLAALCVRREVDPIANESIHSYIFCVNTPNFFSNELIGEASYANFDIVSAVIDNISRIDEHASMDLGGLSHNSKSSGGKQVIPMAMSKEDVTLYSNKYKNDDSDKGRLVLKENHGISTTEIVIYSVIAGIIPLATLVVGAAVCVKRRYL